MSGSGEHRRVRVATITASDTRTEANDEGGALLRGLIEEAGFELGPHRIVVEDLEGLRATVKSALATEGVDALVITGGTGLAPRDVTYEAVLPLLDKVLDGFGEAFRRLSWDEVGVRSILSRAIAGTSGGRFVAAIPGSPAAVKLATTALIAPILEHAVRLASGKAGHHHGGHREKKSPC